MNLCGRAGRSILKIFCTDFKILGVDDPRGLKLTRLQNFVNSAHLDQSRKLLDQSVSPRVMMSKSSDLKPSFLLLLVLTLTNTLHGEDPEVHYNAVSVFIHVCWPTQPKIYGFPITESG